MKEKKIFILTAVLAAFVMAFAVMSKPVEASAESTRDKVRRLQSQIDANNKELRGIKSKKEKRKKEKDNAQKQADLVKQQLSLIGNNITQANQELAEKQQQLEDKKAELAATELLFKDRLRAMYMMRTNNSTLSTVLGANSFSELITATDTVQRVSVADTNLLKYLDEQRIAIETEEAEIEAKIAELESQQRSYQNKQTELAGYLQTLDSSLSQAEAEQRAAEQTQSELYRRYRAAKRQLESELSRIGGSVTEAVGGDYIWPVPSRGHVSSGYGTRYIFGMKDFHTGIDIAKGSYSSISGQPIVASKAGVVVRATISDRGYGNCVMIDHGGNNFTLYGHCSSLAVSEGQSVSQGQTIAYVGSTGNSTGPHLHFEIRLNGSSQKNTVDPLPYVQGTRPRG